MQPRRLFTVSPSITGQVGKHVRLECKRPKGAREKTAGWRTVPSLPGNVAAAHLGTNHPYLINFLSVSRWDTRDRAARARTSAAEILFPSSFRSSSTHAFSNIISRPPLLTFSHSRAAVSVNVVLTNRKTSYFEVTSCVHAHFNVPLFFSVSQMVTRTKKIFVGGLSAPTTLEDVKNYFEQFGPVSRSFNEITLFTSVKSTVANSRLDWIIRLFYIS